jgi:hypothetical protein
MKTLTDHELKVAVQTLNAQLGERPWVLVVYTAEDSIKIASSVIEDQVTSLLMEAVVTRETLEPTVRFEVSEGDA